MTAYSVKEQYGGYTALTEHIQKCGEKQNTKTPKPKTIKPSNIFTILKNQERELEEINKEKYKVQQNKQGLR